MEKLIYKQIEHEHELEKYLDRFFNHTNVNLPLDYAKNSKVIGVYSGETMVAGYMLVTKPGLRSLLFVPDKVKNSQKFFDTDPYEMMEVNGLWISQHVKKPSFQFNIWMHLIKDIFVSRKNYLLLMGSSKNMNIARLHSLTNPEILYEGPPQLMPGDESFESIRVAYTTRWKVIGNIPKYWLELRKRELRAAESGRTKALPQSSTMA